MNEFNEWGNRRSERYYNVAATGALTLSKENKVNRSAGVNNYYANGRLVKVEYVGTDGESLALNNEEIAGWNAEYDASGHETRREFFGIDGKTLVLYNEEIAGWNSEYNASGHETRRELFGVDGKTLVLCNEEIAGWNSEFDASGNEIKRTFFGTDNEPVPLGGDNPFNGWEKTFDSAGVLTSQKWIYVVARLTAFWVVMSNNTTNAGRSSSRDTSI